MVDLRVKIISYDKETNTCKGELLNSKIIEIDPFVGYAIRLTDNDYKRGRGNEVVGKDYLLTSYTVYKDVVVPHESGMTELTHLKSQEVEE